MCAFRCVGPRTTRAGNALQPPRTAGSDQARSLLRLSNMAVTVTTGHRDRLVLFNTGMDPTIASDPNYISSPIGRFLLPKIFRLHIGPDDALDNRLEAVNGKEEAR